MDCQMKEDLKAFAQQFAAKHRAKLGAAVTLRELEALTVQVGDELSRQVTEVEMQRRSSGPAQQESCPDCGEVCQLAEMEPVVLQGVRGEVCYTQPRYYCRRCRRSFFPDGGPSGDLAA